MKTSRTRRVWRAIRWFVYLVIFGAATLGVTSSILWWKSAEETIFSTALGEDREYRIFNLPNSNSVNGHDVVYGLDGEKIRHGLLPATFLKIGSLLRGEEAPIFIAVYSKDTRDIDLRPKTVTPSKWRPDISGRSDAFDRFLIEELRPSLEQEIGKPSQNYILGHSLAGLYALDIAARRKNIFDGVFAFSPTFSHDLSIKDRLATTCRHTSKLYINIGLESGRDTEVFDQVTSKMSQQAACRENKLYIRKHFGMIHQVIMLTGQIDIAFSHLI